MTIEEVFAEATAHEKNMAVLRKSIQEANEGKFVTKTLEELRSMEE